MHPLMGLGVIASSAVLVAGASAAMPTIQIATPGPCEFRVRGDVMYLKNDCVTSTTILVPHGMTLNGNGHTVTAIDPVGNHFKGAVIKNQGTLAHVHNMHVTAQGLANVCDAGDDRLRGIMFEGASGSITNSRVTNINQGPSGCQEGNAIEVRNAPFDGTHPNTQSVKIHANKISDYQKTGIVVNGDVQGEVKANSVSASATQPNLAANGIQFGFGSFGEATQNSVGGNQWCGPSDFAATAFLFFATSPGLNASSNRIHENSDIGMYLFGDMITAIGNLVTDEDMPADCNQFGYDIGIGDYGTGNAVERNVIRGFDMPVDGASEDDNIILKSFMVPTGADAEPFI